MVEPISGSAFAGRPMPVDSLPQPPPTTLTPARTATGVLGQARPPMRLAQTPPSVNAIVNRWGAQIAPGVQRVLRSPAVRAPVPPDLKMLPLPRPIFGGRDPVVLLPGARFDNASAETIDVMRSTLSGFWLHGIESMQDDAQRLYACSLVAQAISEFLAGRFSPAQLKEAIGIIVHDAQFFELPAPPAASGQTSHPTAGAGPGAAGHT
jgi:hypothetical protein